MMKIWWGTSIFWLILFGAAAVFIHFREVDGAGVVQTQELRFVSFIVLGVAFIFIVLCQFVFLYFAKKSKSTSTYKKIV